MKLTLRMEPLPEVVARVFDGEAVLVLPGQRRLNVLNEVGTRIWQLADGRHTLAEIVALISEEYEVDPAQAEADTLAFARLLESKGLVRLIW